MKKKYLVTWEIDAEEDTPEEAARFAWRMRNNKGSIANVFRVTEVNESMNDIPSVVIDLSVRKKTKKKEQ